MSLFSSGFSLDYVIEVAVSVALVMFSAIVHEVAHGYVAHLCGDDTAKEAGRLTLNPKAHLDGFGSFVLPLLMALMGWPMLAFAKPVPYNPYRLKHPRRDELLVALAGPASNILQAIAGAALLELVWNTLVPGYDAGIVAYEVADWAVTIASSYIYVNLVLAFFNLIPIPPLDGSKVLLFFLKGEARKKFYELNQYSFLLLFAVMYLLPRFFSIDPVSWFLGVTADPLYSFLVNLAVGA